MTIEQWEMIDRVLTEKGYVATSGKGFRQPPTRVYSKEYESNHRYIAQIWLGDLDRYFSVSYKVISEESKNRVSFSAETSMNFERETFTEKTLLRAHSMLVYRMFINTGGIYDPT